MNMDANLISGMLSGSLLTLFIKWLLDRFDKKTEFKREIFKITYNKKLEIAESAVAFYWTYQKQAIEMKKSVETLYLSLKDQNYPNTDPQIILTILNKNSEILTQLAGEKYFSVNGIHLYFDLEDEKEWSENDFGEFVSCIAELKYYDNNIQFWSSLYIKHADKSEDKESEYCWLKVDSLMPKYLELVQRLIELLEKDRIATYSMILKIKHQLNQ